MPESSSQNGQQGKPSPSFVSNHAMRVRLRGSITLADLQAALDGLRARHPALIDADAHFPLQETTGCTGTAWLDAARQELLQGFPAGGPFARFVLLRIKEEEEQADLLGVFHHGVCDGMSGVYVLRDILRLLGEPGLVLEALPRPVDMRNLIPTSVRTSRAVQMRVNGFVSILRLRLFFARIFPTRKRPAVEQDSATARLTPDKRMCILTDRLSPVQTAALVQRCKTEGVTVHAAVSTAWLRAFAALPGENRSLVHSASSPVSLRERLSIPTTSGLYMANAVTKINASPRRDFWDAAREFKRKMNRACTDEALFLYPLMIGAVFSSIREKDLKYVLPALFDRPVRYDFSVTNLGRLDLSACFGPLEVEAFTNLVNTSEHERTLCVNTFDGRLTWSLLFRESKMTPSQGRELLRLASEQLSKAVA